MTMYLAITDGTTTFELTDAGECWPLSYVPRRGAPGAESVTETVEMFWYDKADALTDASTLRALFQQAARWNTRRIGSRVYLKFSYDTAVISSANAWRSLILDARIDWSEAGLNEQYGENFLEARITITRVPYFEGALTAVPLTNGNGTDSTSGLTIYNHDDATAGNDNWAAIDEDDIVGDLPAPLKVAIEAVSLTGTYIKSLYVGHNVFSSPASMTHFLEAESATHTGTPTVSASSSGGYYVSKAFSTEELIFYWQLSAVELAKYAGNRFRVLARFTSAAGTGDHAHYQVRTSPSAASGNDVQEGPWVYVSGTDLFADLGVVRLPEYDYGSGNSPYLNYLKLYAYSDDGSSITSKLDYLALMPLDSWRRFEVTSLGIGLVEDFVLADDGPDGLIYVYAAAAATTVAQWFSGYGQPIMAQPGLDQKLYFLAVDNNGAAIIDDEFEIKAWYRPRYENF